MYNLVGKEVYNLIGETQDRGRYTLDFDAAGLPGGVYFYKLQAGQNFMEIKKMLLIRY